MAFREMLSLNWIQINPNFTINWNQYSLKSTDYWFLFFIERSSWSKSDALNIAFKNSSEAMVDQSLGKNVYLPLSTLPRLSGKQFYYHEIIGFTIFDEENNNCGIIESVNDQTAQNYFVTNFGGKEIVIPIIKDWIIEVNREEKYIKMQLPEGLMDVFLTSSKKDE